MDHAPMVNLPPRSRRTRKVSESVAHEIVHDIVQNSLGPGSRLPAEAEMLAAYDVGRASLREALRILEVQGLIQIRSGPGGGPVVAAWNSEDFGRMATLYLKMAGATFRDVIEARLTLEPTMARVVAERSTPKRRARLQAMLDATDAALAADDNDAYLAATAGFHGIVMEMSGNPVLNLFAQSVADVFAARISSLVFPAEARNGVADVHRAIAAAIMDEDGPLAERLMREHMEVYHALAAERFPGMLDDVVDWQ